MAGSLTLLIIAGIFARSLATVRHMDLGFDPHHVTTFTMDAARAGYGWERGAGSYRELQRRLARLMNRWLYGTIQADPAPFVAASAFLAVLSLWVCYVPAGRRFCASTGHQQRHHAIRAVLPLQHPSLTTSTDAPVARRK